MELNTVHSHTIHQIIEEHTYYPRWIVQLCHGVPGSGGVVTDEVHVTKKWERVESVMDDLQEKSLTYPKHERGEWYISVKEIAVISSGDFPLPLKENNVH
jgi:hypothetical protein